MDTYKDVFYAAGLPALISTGITLVYFLSKAYQFAVHAVSHQTEGRLVVVNKSTAQLRETKATRKFMNKYHKVFQTSMAQGSNNPPGPFLYQEDGKTYASLPTKMLRNIQSSHLYQKMQKDCQAEGIEVPKTVMAKDPVAHMVTPQEYLQKVAAGQMPQMNNHQMLVELAAKNDQTKILLMEFQDVESPKNK